MEKIGGVVRLNWSPAASATTYTLIRGTLSELAGGGFGGCLASGMTALTVDDGDPPPAGDPFFHLIRGSNADCGSGTIGYDSRGRERDAGTVGACP